MVKLMPKSRLNTLLILPSNSMSCSIAALLSSKLGHVSEPSASAKNEVEKPGMFTINMPSSAKPRTISSVAMRSLTGSGLTLSSKVLAFLAAAAVEHYCGTFCQLVSGSNSVIAFATAGVSRPRFFS